MWSRAHLHRANDERHHNIRILLQHLSGEPVESADFTFTLTDAANSIFDGANNLLPVEPFTIYPWIKGNTVPPRASANPSSLSPSFRPRA